MSYSHLPPKISPPMALYMATEGANLFWKRSALACMKEAVSVIKLNAFD